MQGYLVLTLIFAIIVALFAIQNTTVVVIKFLVWEANISLVLVILGAVAAGAIMLFLINLVKQIGINRERKELTRQNTRLMKEKEELEKLLSDKDSIIEEKEKALQEQIKQPAETTNDPA